MSERLPRPDGPRIRDTPIGVVDLVTLAAGERLVRVHRLAGRHPQTWNGFRSWGPTRSRFDHHPPPPRDHPRRRIAYLTYGPEAFTTALAEHYQDDGRGVLPFDLIRDRPHVSVVVLASDVRLLDLTGGWVTRAGGNQAIWAGRRSTARDWARAIYRHHRGLIHGVAYPSSVWGPGRCVALWEHAASALPDAPQLHRALADTALAPAVAHAADQLGTACG